MLEAQHFLAGVEGKDREREVGNDEDEKVRAEPREVAADGGQTEDSTVSISSGRHTLSSVVDRRIHLRRPTGMLDSWGEVFEYFGVEVFFQHTFIPDKDDLEWFADLIRIDYELMEAEVKLRNFVSDLEVSHHQATFSVHNFASYRCLS